jgi:hypothetical protein
MATWNRRRSRSRLEPALAVLAGPHAAAFEGMLTVVGVLVVGAA